MTTTAILDGSLTSVWLMCFGYFAHRFAMVTRKLVSLSLAVMSFSCAMLGVLDLVEAKWAVALRVAFLVNGLFVLFSIWLAHRGER